MTSRTDPTTDDIDLTDASVWEQGAPHEWLDRLRADDPVHWHDEVDGPGFWALTREHFCLGANLARLSLRVLFTR